MFKAEEHYTSARRGEGNGAVENEIRKNENGKEYEVQILEVNVVIKDYQDMIKEYRFSQEQIEMIEQMMNY